ncbi:hypothetical protein GFS60_06737 (plasmid) [Rhodococcus sp. WAY2]|nr:hypothetical protein GFS60_06737 [Rhodococcus sp. WAY2]
MIEFDTRWIKVGKTTNWLRRRSDNLGEYRKLGLTVKTPWKSCLLSNESPDNGFQEARRTPTDASSTRSYAASTTSGHAPLDHRGTV